MATLGGFKSSKAKEWSADLWDRLMDALDARFGPLEEQLDIQRATTDAIVRRGLTVIEELLAPQVTNAGELVDEIETKKAAALALVAAIQALLDAYNANHLSADLVDETASRLFLSPALKAAYDGYAAAIAAKATPADIAAAIDALKGGVGSAYDTLVEIAAKLNDDDAALASILTALGSLGTASTKNTGTAAGNVVEVLAGGKLPALDGSNLTGLAGALNRLINPSGQIWQRVNSGAAAITDGTYAYDRWYGLVQSAGVTASKLYEVENGTPYMMRLSQANVTAQRFGIAQAVETVNIIDLRGQDVTLSARVRMSASTTLRYAILEWTGTADAITRDVVNDWTSATYTPGNFFIASNVAVIAAGSVALTADTLASVELTGTASGSMNNAYVVFWTDSAQAQNVTLDIGKAQLERGATATPHAVRCIQQEILLCQRYYEKTYPSGDPPGKAYGSANGGGAFTSYSFGTNNWMSLPTWYFNIRKRATPTVSVYSPLTGASGVVRDSNGSADRAAITNSIGANAVTMGINNVTIANATYIYGHMVADAEL